MNGLAKCRSRLLRRLPQAGEAKPEDHRCHRPHPCGRGGREHGHRLGVLQGAVLYGGLSIREGWTVANFPEKEENRCRIFLLAFPACALSLAGPDSSGGSGGPEESLDSSNQTRKLVPSKLLDPFCWRTHHDRHPRLYSLQSPSFYP